MREIKTKEEIDKKETRRKTTLGVVLVVLLILSTAGYAILNRESSSQGPSSGSGSNSGNSNAQIINYNGLRFENQNNGLWKFEISGAQQPFYSSYTPAEVEKIKVPFISLQELANQPLYYSGNALAVSEIVSNIAPYILRTQEACYIESDISNSTQNNSNSSSKPNTINKSGTSNGQCEGDLPVKNCSSNFLIIKELDDGDDSGNKTIESRVTRKENCLFIESRDSEILKTTDALLFRILGIN